MSTVTSQVEIIFSDDEDEKEEKKLPNSSGIPLKRINEINQEVNNKQINHQLESSTKKHQSYFRTNLGSHLTTQSTLSQTIDYANRLGMYAIQIFNGSP